MTPQDSVTGDALPRPERRSQLRWLGWAALAAVILGLLWVVVTGLIARSKLNTARADIGELRSAVVSGDTERASQLVRVIGDATSDAHRLTTGPAWWVTSNLPGIGTPLRTTREIATQVDRLGSDVLPAVLRVAKTLPNKQNASLSTINLKPVEAAAVPVHRAALVARSALAELRATDGSWLPPVASARTSLVDELSRLDGELQGADRAVQIVPTMLGADGTKRYFIAFMNDAESRAGGGITGAFAIATATNGHVTFEKFGSDTDLAGVSAKVDLGRNFDNRYGNNDPTGVIQNANLSPDFSYAARIWAGMWQAKTGEVVNGAIALDPTALSYLLAVTGPSSIPGGITVSADNVVALTQQQQYSLFPNVTAAANNERKQFLTNIAKTTSTKLTSGAGSPTGLVRAASHAAKERRLTVWSADAAVETQLRESGWGGTLGDDEGHPYSGFTVNNAAGSKLDYYLDRRMTYQRSQCGAGGSATATFAMTNNAPDTGLPSYVTIRADKPPKSARPGDNRVLLTYYADRDAHITSFSVAGKAVPFVPQYEGDTIAATVTVELPAGTTVAARVTVAEPRADGKVDVLEQPGVRPLEVDLAADRCG